MSRFFSVALVLSVALTTACSRSEPPPTPELARPARLFTVEGPDAAMIRSFPAEVRASEEADLAFRVSGKIVELPATRGLRVVPGQLLAQLDPADFEAARAQARAQFDLSTAQFNRAAELVDRKLISQAEYDSLLAQMQVAEADLTRASNNLDYTSLLAPFEGIVATRRVENFENVLAGQVIMVLQTENMLDLVFNVPESIISRLQRRNPSRNDANIKVHFGSSQTEYDAFYKEHESNADPATLTFRVTATMPTPTKVTILPGMSATVTANLAKLYASEITNLTIVPIEAVFSAETEALDAEYRHVWVVDPETMRASDRRVITGALSGDRIAIKEGLVPGEVVISAGVNAVEEGMLVRPMKRERGL